MLNWGKTVDQARLYLKTFKNPPAATHESGKGVNRYVEAARASAYTVGHASYLRLPAPFYARAVVVLDSIVQKLPESIRKRIDA